MKFELFGTTTATTYKAAKGSQKAAMQTSGCLGKLNKVSERDGLVIMMDTHDAVAFRGPGAFCL